MEVVLVIVGGGGLGQQGVGRGVKAVREGDGQGGRDVRVAGAEVEVPAGQAEVGRVIRTEAGVLLQAVVLSLVPPHGDPLQAVVLHGHHVDSPAHDGQHHGEPVAQPAREAARLQASINPVTAGVPSPGTE